jgi:hypothetical protein
VHYLRICPSLGLHSHPSSNCVPGWLACNPQVYQAMLQLTSHPSLDLPAVISIPLSAGTAGFFLSFVLSPAELIKARRGKASSRLLRASLLACL